MEITRRRGTRVVAGGVLPRSRRTGHRAYVASTGALIGLATTLALASAAFPYAVAAVSGTTITFEETFARSEIVAVATVEAAPPSDPAFRLTVERMVKGPAESELTFPADPKAVELEPGSRIVLLAADATSLDFRGTVALVVAGDGTIDPDGLVGVPATVADLVAAYGTPATSTDLSGEPERGFPTGAAVAVIAIIAVMLVAGALAANARRHARGR